MLTYFDTVHLCAMVRTVQFLNSCRMVAWIRSSVSRSTAAVASSRTRTFVFPETNESYFIFLHCLNCRVANDMRVYWFIPYHFMIIWNFHSFGASPRKRNVTWKKFFYKIFNENFIYVSRPKSDNNILSKSTYSWKMKIDNTLDSEILS